MATIKYKTKSLKEYHEIELHHGQGTAIPAQFAELVGRETPRKFLQNISSSPDPFKRSFLRSLVVKIERESASLRKREFEISDDSIIGVPEGEHSEIQIHSAWMCYMTDHGYTSLGKVLEGMLPRVWSLPEILNIPNLVAGYSILLVTFLLMWTATMLSVPVGWLTKLPRKGHQTFDHFEPEDSGWTKAGKVFLNFGRFCGICLSPFLWFIAQPLYLAAHILSSAWMFVDALSTLIVKTVSMLPFFGHSDKYPDYKEIFALAGKHLLFLGIVFACAFVLMIPVVGEVFAGAAIFTGATAFFNNLALAGVLAAGVQLITGIYETVSKWILNKIFPVSKSPSSTPRKNSLSETEVDTSDSKTVHQLENSIHYEFIKRVRGKNDIVLTNFNINEQSDKVQKTFHSAKKDFIEGHLAQQEVELSPIIFIKFTNPVKMRQEEKAAAIANAREFQCTVNGMDLMQARLLVNEETNTFMDQAGLDQINQRLITEARVANSEGPRVRKIEYHVFRMYQPTDLEGKPVENTKPYVKKEMAELEVTVSPKPTVEGQPIKSLHESDSNEEFQPGSARKIQRVGMLNTTSQRQNTPKEGEAVSQIVATPHA